MEILPDSVIKIEEIEIIEGPDDRILNQNSSSFRFKDSDGESIYIIYFWQTKSGSQLISKKDLIVMKEYFIEYPSEKELNPNISRILNLLIKIDPTIELKFSQDTALITLSLSSEAIINHLHFSVSVNKSEYTIHEEILNNSAYCIELAIYSLSFLNQHWLKMLNFYCNKNIDNGIGKRASARIFKPERLLSRTEAQLFGHLSLLCLMKPFNIQATSPQDHASGFLTKRIPPALAALGRSSKLILQGDNLSKYAVNISQALTILPNLRKQVYLFLSKFSNQPLIKHALLLLKNANLSSFIQINNFLSNPNTRAHFLPEIMNQGLLFNNFWSEIIKIPEWEYIFFFDPDKLTKTRNDFDKLAFCAIELLKEESETYQNFVNPAVIGNISLKNALSQKVVLKDKSSLVDPVLFKQVYKFDYIEPETEDIGDTFMSRLNELILRNQKQASHN